MKEDLFAELLQSAKEALEHAQGKRELRTTVLPAPPAPMGAGEIRKLRATLHASQAVFAKYLNVSTKLVQAWEAQRRHPEGAALKLLRLAQNQPAVLLTDSPITDPSNPSRPRRSTAAAANQGRGRSRNSAQANPRMRRASA